jgi:multidrug efflux pump
MFGMVLAIGILVDDAIVVVENVERIMAEEGLQPKPATQKAMREVSGALVGITLVLIAVFLPMAFFGGSVGIIYQQFSVTMVCSLSLSMFLALSLTPALCATMLKPVSHGSTRKGVFGWFNRSFSYATDQYEGAVRHVLRRVWVYGLAFLMVVGALGFLYLRLPSSFLPEEDQGYFVTQVSLPEGSTHGYTLKTVEAMEKFYLEQPEVDSLIAVAGFSYNGRAQNSAKRPSSRSKTRSCSPPTCRPFASSATARASISSFKIRAVRGTNRCSKRATSCSSSRKKTRVSARFACRASKTPRRCGSSWTTCGRPRSTCRSPSSTVRSPRRSAHAM